MGLFFSRLMLGKVAMRALRGELRVHEGAYEPLAEWRA